MEGRVGRALRSTRLTLFFLALLFLTFAFEVLVLRWFGMAAYRSLFLATLTPSPGWVLAPFAHSLHDPNHLLGVGILFALVGPFVETRLAPARYFTLFVGTAYISVFAQVATYLIDPGAGTFGASGAVLALTTFLAVDTAFDALEGETVEPMDGAVAIAGVAIVVARIALDLGIVVDQATGSAPVGHLAGAFVGVSYAVWRESSDPERREGESAE